MKNVLTVLAMCLCLPLMGADKAKEEFEKMKALAEKGDRVAQYNLGVMYDQGEGVERDFKEAVKWWRKAAEQGHADAQSNLVVHYYKGEGVKQDNVTAYAWCNIAVANGDKGARQVKPIIAKKMTPEQIAKAQELSKEMLKKNPKLLKK